MEFSGLFIKYSLLFCLLGGPVAIFMVQKTAPNWQKTLKLLVPLFVFCASIGYTSLSKCPQNQLLECISFKGLFLLIATLQYIMFLGWFEYIWRRWHKQVSWPLKKNFQYGVVSNTFIAISACMTILMVTFLTIQMILLPLFQGN